MLDEAEDLTIQVNDKEAVTALVYPADKKNRAGTTVVLGHGAGGPQTSGFMRMFAKGLAARGLDVLRSNFLSLAQGRSVPDQKPKLEACGRAVIEAALKQKKLKKNRLGIGGKSMGGRIASQVMAGEEIEGFADAVAGLVFLGYPMPPPGNPAKLRVEHLEHIHKPMLFVQGTRDTLGTPEEIQPYIKNLRPAAKIYAIEGGDHSFRVPKKFGRSPEQIFENAMDEIDRWVRSI